MGSLELHPAVISLTGVILLSSAWGRDLALRSADVMQLGVRSPNPHIDFARIQGKPTTCDTQRYCLATRWTMYQCVHA